MVENWEEDEEEEDVSASRLSDFIPQYSLRTLMIVVTGAAVFFSLVAWWGLYPVVFILGSALGIFLGLLICSIIGLGFAFENLPWDIAKCLMIACATIGPLYILPLLPFFSTTLYVFAPALVFWLCIKIAWNDIETHEIFLAAVVSFFTWGTVSYLVSLIFGT